MDDFVDGVELSDPFDPVAEAKDEKIRDALITDEEQRAKDFLQRRRLAYARVFSAGVTDQADLDIVLTDLAKFCRAFSGALFDKNDGPHAETLAKMKDGRREVYMRILDHTRLDLDTLFLKYTGATTR